MDINDRKRAITLAAEYHSDLNTFATVVSILEGGHLYSFKSQNAAQRIIDLCHIETQRCLKDYDKAVAQACKK